MEAHDRGEVQPDPEPVKVNVEKPLFAIKRNSHGNYEHTETKLVFDNQTKQAIGTQNEDGTISTLTEHDIDVCKQYKFNYSLPDNLDENSTEEVVVEEMVEEEEIIEGELIEEVEIIEEEEVVEDEKIKKNIYNLYE